ncbi:MAG: hypothetical protein AAGU05_07010 [Anaerolineaceae bacterium]
MTDFKFEIKGIDKLIANLKNMRREIILYMGAAGREAAEEILSQKGLRDYPASTPANQPPTPYYKRGQGMQYASKNDGRSERYGTKFYAKTNSYVTRIGNSASYAKYLTDENQQAAHMAKIGWKKLIGVAVENKQKIKDIFQAWVDKLIKDYNL